MLANATRLCDATFGTLTLFDEASMARNVALQQCDRQDYAETWLREPWRSPCASCHGSRAIRTKQITHITDLSDGPLTLKVIPRLWRLSTSRVLAPYLTCRCSKKASSIGTITIFSPEVRPFTEKQITLISELCQSGSHRDRERPTIGRVARPHRASWRVRLRSCGCLAMSARRSIPPSTSRPS